MAEKQYLTDETLPSYVDSIEQHSNSTATNTISNQLTTTRTSHLQSIIETVIFPVIHQRASQGLSNTNFALLPSNTFESTTDAKVIGLASRHDDTVEQIQLEGNINRDEFWRQSAVVAELQRLLLENLRNSSSASPFSALKSHMNAVVPPASPPAPTSGDMSLSVSKRPRTLNNFFSRRSSSAASSFVQTELPAPVTNPQQVAVRIEELCVRTISEFGLYETLTRPVVFVEVRIST